MSAMSEKEITHFQEEKVKEDLLEKEQHEKDQNELQNLYDKEWLEIKKSFRNGNMTDTIRRLKTKQKYATEDNEKRKILLWLTDSFLVINKVERAKRCVKEANKIKDDKAGKYYESKVCFAEKDHDTGIRILKHNVEENPFSAIDHYLLGKYYERVRKNEDSLAQYRWAVKLKPDNPRFHVGVIKILLRLKRYNMAVNECESLVGEFKYSELYILYAKVLRMMGEDEKAKEVLSKVIKDMAPLKNKEENLFVPDFSFTQISFEIPTLTIN